MYDSLVFLDFGFITIYWYGLFMAVNILLTALLYSLLRTKQGESFGISMESALFAMPFALIFSRIFYCWFSISSFQDDMTEMLNLTSGGYSLYGAVIGALPVLLIHALAQKKSLLSVLDAAAPALAFGIMSGRFIGITASSDMGFTVEGSFCQRQPFAFWSEADKAWHLWIGFFEGIAALFIFVYIAAAFLRIYGKNKKNRQNGDIALLFMLTYGLSQAFLESMRDDALFMVTLGFVRINQIISIVMALAAIVIIAVRKCRTEGFSAAQAVIWLVCTACLSTAVYCEFVISASTMAVCYMVMGSVLLITLIASLYLYISAKEIGADNKQK